MVCFLVNIEKTTHLLFFLVKNCTFLWNNGIMKNKMHKHKEELSTIWRKEEDGFRI